MVPCRSKDAVPANAPGDPVLALSGISKRFGNTWANRDISLEAHAGEVHAVVGQNGAGKSTLMAIIYGHLQPDAGSIRIDGCDVRFRHPRDAIRAGVGMIHQQLLIFPQLDVLQNIIMGHEPRRLGWVKSNRARATIESLQETFDFDLPLDYPAGNLSYAHRQQLELLRLVYRQARILLLDEPTSLLSAPEVDRLLGMLTRLKKAGKTILFISHRLDEVLAVADQISVLHRGQKILNALRGEFDHDTLVSAIMGRDRSLGAIKPDDAKPFTPGGSDQQISPGAKKPTVLRLIDARSAADGLEAGLETCNFELASGEILGMGAIVGNGLRSLAAVVTGSKRPIAGKVILADEDISKLDVARRILKGLLWLPADPEEEATLANLSLWENFLLGHQRSSPFVRRGVLQKRRIRAWVADGLQRLQVAYGDLDNDLTTLSGGNRQKVVLSRILAGSPRLIVLEQPTRGLDIKAKTRCYEWLNRLAEDGTACLVCSYDIDELLEICDRIGILYRGRLMGLVPAGDAHRRQLTQWMLGRRSADTEFTLS